MDPKITIVKSKKSAAFISIEIKSKKLLNEVFYFLVLVLKANTLVSEPWFVWLVVQGGV